MKFRYTIYGKGFAVRETGECLSPLELYIPAIPSEGWAVIVCLIDGVEVGKVILKR
jgi:hypothetical protein